MKTWLIVLLSSASAMACVYFYSTDHVLIGSAQLTAAVLFSWWAQHREAQKK